MFLLLMLVYFPLLCFSLQCSAYITGSRHIFKIRLKSRSQLSAPLFSFTIRTQHVSTAFHSLKVMLLIQGKFEICIQYSVRMKSAEVIFHCLPRLSTITRWMLTTYNKLFHCSTGSYSSGICARFSGQLCEQICRDVAGSYACSCRDGYTLQSDRRTCRQNGSSELFTFS